MKNRIRFVALTLLLVSAAAGTAQTVPALINYQGRLANPDGTALATGDYTLTFRVYDSATNGTGLVWGPQLFDGVNAQGHGGKIPVVQGYFNVILGPVDTNGVSLADAFNATNRYVEIRVGTNSPILPRQQILSAPFALNSAKLVGADWSAVFGTNDPVNGKIPTTKLATNGVLLAQQIGVGTANPLAKLDVMGDLHVQGDVNANTATPYSAPLRVSRADNNGRYLYLGYDSGNFAFLQPIDQGVAFKNLALNPSGGNVGIGTTTPQVRLDVSGNLRVSSDANAAVFPTNAAFRISRSDDSNKYVYMGYDSDGFAFIQPIHQGVAYRPLVLNPSGANVGIGTTTPQTKLDVNGTVTATAFNPSSDRNRKENFQSVEPQLVLQKLTALPITRWNFIGDDATPHLGPMAQDFHAAFGLGTDERHIATVDADGVALAAIQGLNQKLEEKLKEKDAEIESLKARLERLESGNRPAFEKRR